jgi:hypothetical protein
LGDNDLLRSYRRIFKTRKGYLGLGQREADVDDRVALVIGAKVPLVMSKMVRGGNRWEVNGDYYLHGVMHGEMFEKEKCDRMEIV